MAIITSIIKTTKNKGKMYEIFVDEISIGLLHVESIAKYRLKEGKQVDADWLKQIIFESNVILCVESASKLLTRRFKTEQELRLYLLNKGFAQYEIDVCIDRMKEYKYVDDESYCKGYINMHKSTKGVNLIKRELKIKGVEENLVEQAVTHLENQEEYALNLAQKYMKGKTKNIKTKQKLNNYLYSRGYEWEIISSVLKKIFTCTNDIE